MSQIRFSTCTEDENYGMRNYAYHSPIFEIFDGPLGYVGGAMDKNKDRRVGRVLVMGDLEVYRSSPYEFCQTAEPVSARVDGGTSVIVPQGGGSQVPPLIVQSVTYQG